MLPLWVNVVPATREVELLRADAVPDVPACLALQTVPSAEDVLQVDVEELADWLVSSREEALDCNIGARVSLLKDLPVVGDSSSVGSSSIVTLAPFLDLVVSLDSPHLRVDGILTAETYSQTKTIRK